MTDTGELRRLLDEATTGPWERVTEGSHNQRDAAAKAFLSVWATRAADNAAIDFTDLTFVREPGDRNVAMVGNGPKQTENGDLIVAAVNALPVLLDVVEAAKGYMDHLGDLAHPDDDECCDTLERAVAALADPT